MKKKIDCVNVISTSYTHEVWCVHHQDLNTYSASENSCITSPVAVEETFKV